MRCKFSKLNICRLVAAFIAVMLAAALFVPCISAAANSGSCGSGLKWEYSSGMLTISGKGAMDNYTETKTAPWDSWKKDIRVVKIGSGVTCVGNLAFYAYPALVSVTLSDSVTTIGKFAFADCRKLSMVSLGAGLRSIGNNSFDDCESLQSIRLPEGLNSIGQKAFYSCGALRSITIPKSVTSLGTMCFGYCDNMVSATVNASISNIPERTFYGCEKLSDITFAAAITSVNYKAFQNCDKLETVYYLGTPAAGVTVQSEICEDLEDVSQLTLKCSANTNGQSQTTVTRKDENNVTVIETVTVQQSESASIATTVTTQTDASSSGNTSAGDSTAQIQAVIEKEEGWGELVDQIKQVTTEIANNSSSKPKVQVSVDCNSSDSMDGDKLSDLSGKNVSITVNMNDGSSVKIDCNRLDGSNMSGNHNMSYSVTENTKVPQAHAEALGNADSYALKFSDNTEFDFSPQIYVGDDLAHSCATLYQVQDDGSLGVVQSSIIDKDGNATFYLKSAYKNSEYVVGIDVPGIDRSSAIVPESLMMDYGITDQFDEIIEYSPTEDREFMGMNIGQFSFALFGGMGALIVIFGVVMSIFYRKKRLEMMYRLKMQDQAEQE